MHDSQAVFNIEKSIEILRWQMSQSTLGQTQLVDARSGRSSCNLTLTGSSCSAGPGVRSSKDELATLSPAESPLVPWEDLAREEQAALERLRILDVGEGGADRF